MKRYWIEYHDGPVSSPMTYWVHGHPGEADADPSLQALPSAVPGKGYARVHAEIDGLELRFVSLAEIRHCIDVLGRKHLPTTTRLSVERGTGAGPNGHWLSRLPARAKTWRYREKATKYLAQLLNEIERT